MKEQVVKGLQETRKRTDTIGLIDGGEQVMYFVYSSLELDKTPMEVFICFTEAEAEIRELENEFVFKLKKVT